MEQGAEERDTRKIEAKRRMTDIEAQQDFLHKISKVFGTPEGHEVLEWILSKCHFQSTPVDPRHLGMQEFANVLFFTVNKANTSITQTLFAKWSKDFRFGLTKDYQAQDKILKGGDDAV